MRVSTRRALLVAAGLAAAGAVAVAGCRDRNQRGTASGPSDVAFKPGGVVGTYLSGFDVIQDHLWVATEGGIAVIDPVDETWTMLDLGGRKLGAARIVRCGPDIWVLPHDVVLLVNLKDKTVQDRGLPPGVTSLDAINSAFCDSGGLWLYPGRDSGLFRMPTSVMVTERYELRAPGRSRYFSYAEALQSTVYLLAPQYLPGRPPEGGLFRFEPATGAFDRVALPGGALPVTLGRIDDGLVVRTSDAKTFLLKADGQPWTETAPPTQVPPTTFGNLPILAQSKGVVWVGASYDVSPASYFVLRYINDAMEPKDLVILPREWYGGAGRRTVQYLGMLWVLLGSRVLRIDPMAEELVSYELTDTTGKLKKKSFPLTRDSAGVRFFDGDTVRPFAEPGYEPEPASPDSADVREKPEG